MRSTTTNKRARGGLGRPLAGRKRVNQESVDAMAELRRQGLTFKEIEIRLGCSERTVRRYTSQVEPRIQLPAATPELETKDPRCMRDDLARWYSDLLYNFPGHPRPRESVRFMAAANRIIREALEKLDALTLKRLYHDMSFRLKLVRENLSYLYDDYQRHIQWDSQWNIRSTAASAAAWRSPWERSAIPVDDDDE